MNANCNKQNSIIVLPISDPRQIYVPAEATTAMLIGSSRFRSKARLPVLTYLHSNQASICRCSQPLSGFSARCLEDEQMLEAIRHTNPNNKFMYVVDTRPRVRLSIFLCHDFEIVFPFALCGFVLRKTMENSVLRNNGKV